MKKLLTSKILVVGVLVFVWIVLILPLLLVSLWLLLLLLFCVFLLIPPAHLPVADVDSVGAVLVCAEPLPPILGKLSIVDVVLGFPLESKAMLAALIEVLGLPPAKVALAVEVPDEADIPGDDHGAVGVTFDHQVLTGDPQLAEDAPGRLVEV